MITFQKLSIPTKTRNLLLEKKNGTAFNCTPLQMQWFLITETNVFKAHNCIVPLNTGNYWVTLFFLDLEKKTNYHDSFGNPPHDKLLNLVNKRFLFCPTQHNSIKLQHDSYQFSVWWLECKKRQEKKWTFLLDDINEKVTSFSNNTTLVSNDFPRSLRKTCTATIHKNMFESSLQNETPIPQPINDNQFFFETFSKIPWTAIILYGMFLL